MRLFTCTRTSEAEFPERRVPIISGPFDFQHVQHTGIDNVMSGLTSFPSASQPVQHGNLGEEMQSITQVLNTRAPTVAPPSSVLNGYVSNPAMKETPSIKSVIQTDRKLANRKARVHMGVDPTMDIPPLKNLRSVFSTPELRDPDVFQDATRLRPTVSRSSGYGPSRRKSWFSFTTDIIEGRRTMVRKVFDTFGCTKSDKFDIYEFEFVKPPRSVVAQAFRSTNSTGSSKGNPKGSSLSWGKTRVFPANAFTRRR